MHIIQDLFNDITVDQSKLTAALNGNNTVFTYTFSDENKVILTVGPKDVHGKCSITINDSSLFKTQQWLILGKLLVELRNLDRISSNDTITINNFSLSVRTLIDFIWYNKRAPIDQDDVETQEKERKLNINRISRAATSDSITSSRTRTWTELIRGKGGSKKS